VKAKLVAIGVEPKPMTPGEFGAFTAAEIGKWAKVLTFAKVEAE
jgi:hypothetical protein